MIRISLLAGAALALGLALPALAETLAPSAIVANPASYEGKPVTVQGKVANFQTSKTPMGTVVAFQVCDTKCVLVIDQSDSLKYADGDSATVSGTFRTTFKGPRRSFNNVILYQK
jgi:cytochrome c-type biogenesis protein CcmE